MSEQRKQAEQFIFVFGDFDAKYNLSREQWDHLKKELTAMSDRDIILMAQRIRASHATNLAHPALQDRLEKIDIEEDSGLWYELSEQWQTEFLRAAKQLGFAELLEEFERAGEGLSG